MKKKLIMLALLFLIPAIVYAVPGTAPKTAVWDANTETDLAGYYLYWGSPGTFNNNDKVDVGLSTTYDLVGVPGPQIAITAYDTSNNESEYSDAVPLDGSPPSKPSSLSVIPTPSP
jgi:hypothetical protein